MDGAKPTTGHRIAIAAVLGLSAILVFFRLGAPRLWVDEAETALLGRSILHHGVPKAVDGKNVISQEAGREFGADHVWRWTPWLDKYVAAASFLVLGEGTVPARLPFAIVGLLSIAAVYPLAMSLFRDPRVALLAMAFLATSVPFLLHVRQCRYYSLAVLGFTGAIVFLVAILKGRRLAPLGFVLSASVLFHANYLSFVAAIVALGSCAFLLGVDRAALRRLALVSAALVVVSAPWAVFFNVLGKAAETGRVSPFAENLTTYLQLTLRYAFPAIAVAAFAVLALATRRRSAVLDRASLGPFLFLLAVPAVYLVVVSAGPWVFFRYIVSLLPVFAVILAFVSVRVWDWNRPAGASLGTMLLLTGLLHEASALPFPELTAPWTDASRSNRTFDRYFPLGNFVEEIAHPFVGATDAIVDYLATNARPGDRAFVSYGDLVVRFYSTLEVRGGMTGQTLAGWGPPEWIVVRRFFRFGGRPHLRADADAMAAWLERDVPWSRYREVLLPQPDLPWESIPEPHRHWYRAPKNGERLRIFRLATSSP